MTYTSLVLVLVGFLSERVHASDDSDPLTAVVQRLATEVTELKARMDALDNRVAFSARFSASHPTVQKASPFRFDEVLFNDGNAYDSQLGIFTAPASGVYVFSVQVFTSSPERPLVDFRVNGDPSQRMALDTSQLADSAHGEDSVSMTGLLKLTSGDRVWVESISGPFTFWGSFHTFFSGFLMYAS